MISVPITDLLRSVNEQLPSRFFVVRQFFEDCRMFPCAVASFFVSLLLIV